MPTTVPTAFRQIDPSIPPDRQIKDHIAAINIPQEVGVPAQERAIAALITESTAAVLQIAQMAAAVGTGSPFPSASTTPSKTSCA